MGTILSIVLSAAAALIFMWLNVKQRDFDKLQNKSK